MLESDAAKICRQMVKAIMSGRNSHVGPDGLPRQAWRSVHCAPSLFTEIDNDLKEGTAPADDFNISLGVFPQGRF